MEESSEIRETSNLKTKDNTNEDDDIFKKKDCKFGFCCQYCSEDIMFGITFPGRMIMTLYSFQALFFIYNFIINFIFLLPGMLYFTNDIIVITLVFLVYAFFASLCSNILIIPTYECLLFGFLRIKNVLAHLESLKITMNIIHYKNYKNVEIDYNKSNIITDLVLIFIEIAYAVGFFSGFSSETIYIKDIVRVIIFFLIYFYYLIIFFGYFFISLDLKFHLIFQMIKERKDCNFLSNIFLHNDEYINDFFKERAPLPKINLISYIVNPLLDNSYSDILNIQDQNDNKDCFNLLYRCICCKFCSCCEGCCCKNWFYTFKIIVRFIAFFISLILSLLISSKQNPEKYVYFIIFFFYLFSYFLSSFLNFPYLIRNQKVYFLFSTKYKFKKEYNLEHPIIVSFIRLVSFLIIFFVSIGLLIVYIVQDETNKIDTIKNLKFDPIPDIKDKSKLKPSICFSSVNDLYMYLYLPFINDAYYYDSNPKESEDFYSSFHIKGYKELFFDKETYDIKPIGNLITSKDKNKVKMIQYDITKKKIENDGDISITNEITILAIKGTTNKKDIFLDLQLYLPSLLLNYLSYFSLFSQQKDTYAFAFLEYSLSLPYRLFSQYLIIDGYLKDLLDAYNKNKSKFKKNIVIVGHSLGGGLSKIFGRFLGKQAISLSGPGVNAFHTLWEYEGSSENFEISAIDLVPDMDLVPRVEVSGGTIYRIICKEGPLDCHGKELSLCEVLIMCRNPNYPQYCDKMAKISEEQMETIKESSEL